MEQKLSELIRTPEFAGEMAQREQAGLISSASSIHTSKSKINLVVEAAASGGDEDRNDDADKTESASEPNATSGEACSSALDSSRLPVQNIRLLYPSKGLNITFAPMLRLSSRIEERESNHRQITSLRYLAYNFGVPILCQQSLLMLCGSRK